MTVEDGSGESNDTDRITVTIEVKDLDEEPVIDGEANIDYFENGTGPVATLAANDPEGVTPIYWSILPDDAEDGDLPGGDGIDDTGSLDVAEDGASFRVKDGVLKFQE